MSKGDLVELLAAQLDVPKTAAGRAVDAMLGLIEERLIESGSFGVPGFGTFTRRETAARQARNPRTGETVKVPAGIRISFRAGAPLKAAMAQTKKTARKKAA